MRCSKTRYLGMTMMPVRESFIIIIILAISVVHKLFTEYLSAAGSYS